MKKFLLCSVILLSLAGCQQFNPDEIIREVGNPFKEYAVPDTKIAEVLETGILETEAESKGLDMARSTAHLIDFTKIGSYGKGEVRILANRTPEKLAELKKKNPKITEIVTYTCYVEYSYKNGYFVWTSNYIEL